MSNNEITPPPELVQQWAQMPPTNDIVLGNWVSIATQAARWGADQELEACASWLLLNGWCHAIGRLRIARRQKPPSLKEQALAHLDSLHADLKRHGLGTNTDTIRRALEALPDD